jgi:hypothetical protein
MYVNIMPDVVDRLIRSKIANKRQVRGYTATEVVELEEILGTQLPLAFIDFLLAMGHGAGSFYQDANLFGHPDGYAYLKEAATETLEENGSPFALPDDAFVLSMYQGFAYLYFNLNSEDDPAVYKYVELDRAPKKVSDTFSKWIHGALQDEINYRRSGAEINRPGCQP